jgi:acyl-CoA synthetase (AMP-forming)/AMP-acid ligase II
MPGVAQVAVIGVPDERLGEVAMAFVVATPVRPDPRSIVAWCRENMAGWPRRVAIVETRPDATGKVTVVLRELTAARP